VYKRQEPLAAMAVDEHLKSIQEHIKKRVADWLDPAFSHQFPKFIGNIIHD
jgi:hypothetical protein